LDYKNIKVFKGVNFLMQFEERFQLGVNEKSIFVRIMQMVVILTTLFLLTIPVHANTLNGWHVASNIGYKTPFYEIQNNSEADHPMSIQRRP